MPKQKNKKKQQTQSQAQVAKPESVIEEPKPSP